MGRGRLVHDDVIETGARGFLSKRRFVQVPELERELLGVEVVRAMSRAILRPPAPFLPQVQDRAIETGFMLRLRCVIRQTFDIVASQ